jgi:hypothetical protein
VGHVNEQPKPSAVPSDASSSGVAPLWTAEESPSDLLVESETTSSGVVVSTDVHVL